MSPTATLPPSLPPFASRDGQSLEATSDAIESLNLSHSLLPSPKPKSSFRQYPTTSSPIRDFYIEQHTKQTVSYNLLARHLFHTTTRAHMTVWAALEKLNTLLDASDPDTSLSQIEHLLQSAEAIRRDNHPRWFQLVGLIHDLGKLLFFYSARGQWDVVGDTFPVGCRFDEDAIVYPGTFSANPDTRDEIYSSEYGIYSKGCGLEKVMLSWGHDEYMYHVCKEQSRIPEEGLAIIRYHSFYAWHTGGGYWWMMDGERDERMLEAVRRFNPYDLYSKSDEVPRVEELKGYYLELINEFFPPREGEEARVVRW